MSKDLTTSQIDRQNILNNDVALSEIEKAVNLKCIVWDDRLYLTKDMVAAFFGVDIRTIERYISKYSDELESNGYTVLKGKKLQEFLDAYESNFATDINVGRKIRALSVFDFRAFLNMAMLLVESETAFELRRIILDIVIDKNNHSAIITEEIFAAVQKEKSNRSNVVMDENGQQVRKSTKYSSKKKS